MGLFIKFAHNKSEIHYLDETITDSCIGRRVRNAYVGKSGIAEYSGE